MNNFLIDDLLEQMAIEGRNHFAPHYICQRLGFSDSEIDQVTDYLLKLNNYKVIALYEVECPNGDSDFIVTDPSKIDNEIKTCHCCFEEYVPDPDRIWLVFNFTNTYLNHVKKKPLFSPRNNIQLTQRAPA